MKLELKHLAPYLPYGLKIYCPDSNRKIQEIKPFDLGVEMLNFLNSSTRKPILRPLSDLTKEIDGKCYWLLIEEIEMRYFRTKNSQIDKLCVKTYKNLLENHFDVFGLIGKGLAININEL